MELHEQIRKLFAEKGMTDEAEEYNRRISKADMFSELTAQGFDREAIDKEIERLCLNGTLAMDEVNIYDYDEPV